MSMVMKTQKPILEDTPLSPELLRKMDAYWRAANYLSAAQIFLLANPLLQEPLADPREGAVLEVLNHGVRDLSANGNSSFILSI